ncbi:MAG: M23 family metallopeptidase [Actinomycetota bacterium]|nr:M23 family metallopeptidase [Actinomycetota bacterium]
MTTPLFRSLLGATIVLCFLLPPAPLSARRYAPPVKLEGRVFPVARTNWYSVINFTNDWHAPRMRLVNGEWQQIGVHEGTDIFAEPGTPIRSIDSGVVENIGWTFYSGWRVGVRGDDGRYWFYAHLSRYARGISEGTRVEAGTRLGSVGNTGYGFTPGHRDEFTWHLHFGLQEPSGMWVNPYPMLRRLYAAATRR